MRKIWNIAGITVLCLGAGLVLSSCKGKETINDVETGAAVESLAAQSVETAVQTVGAVPNTKAAQEKDAPVQQDWLSEGDGNDEYYVHTCEPFDFMEYNNNPEKYEGSRITASVTIALDRAPVYYAADSVGNEYRLLDARTDRSQTIQLNDHVQVYGEFVGIGTDAENEADSDDFVIRARVIQKQEQGSKNVTDSAVRSRLEAMLPVFDSLLLAYSEEDTLYAPKDPEYFWRAVYLMMANYGEMHTLASVEDGILSLPRMAAQEYASALFYDYSDLPVQELDSLDMPQITYDADWDAVKIALSDRGEEVTKIVAMRDMGDGAYLVTAQLQNPETGEALYTGVFDLQPNPYADAVAEPVYYFSVSWADIVKGE